MPNICPNCRHENRPGARFCSRCRTALPVSQPAASPTASRPAPASSPQATRKVCPICYTQNRMDAGFCSGCGHTFSQTSSPRSARRRRIVGLGAAAALLGVLALLVLAVWALNDRGGSASPSPTPSAKDATATPATVLAATPTLPAAPTDEAAPTVEPTSTTVAPGSPLNTSLLATVQILVPVDGVRGEYSTGSGSVLTTQGHVLTNYHVLVDVETGEPFNRREVVFIAVTPDDLRGEPEMAYRAEVVEQDQLDDLALLKIVATSDDGPLPASFRMVRMPVGDSETVRIGDELTILGYPGLGGESITLTRGSVSGFIDSEGWIKTDAEINPGNSGGAAVNSAGELVGIPTAGTFDEDFPGKLGLVRPVNRARGLIDRALREAGEMP